MFGIFHHKDAVEELKCPKSVLLQRSKMVILRGTMIKLQAGVCASSIFFFQWNELLSAVNFCSSGELNVTARVERGEESVELIRMIIIKTSNGWQNLFCSASEHMERERGTDVLLVRNIIIIHFIIHNIFILPAGPGWPAGSAVTQVLLSLS